MRLIAALSIALSASAQASPQRGAPQDDRGSIGGFLSRDKPERKTVETSWWLAPVRGLLLRFRLGDRAARSYSTAERPRELAGAVALACAGQQGEPCIASAGWADVESAVGYSDQLLGVLRVRGTLDSSGAGPSIQRLYLRAQEYGGTLEIGRDALAFGPSARTQLSWGTSSPPLDHVRVSTSRPIALTRALHASAQYVVGRLRDPQTYPGTLVTITHGQLDVGPDVELGVVQVLQLEGDGAPHLGIWDFVLEHVHRKDSSATSTDSSNRRFGGDVSVRIPALEQARLYYAIMFEDIRKARWIDAIRYDADHLFGVEVRGVTVEWHQTGVRSQEHTPRTTGFTNGGFVVGAPLGPDAESLYAGARLDLGKFTLYPWLELARLSSDTYEFIVDGPINRTSIGEDEARYRFGTRVRFPVRENLWIEGEAMFEHVDDFAFESGATRNNGGLTASIIWYPRGPLGRLSLN